MSTTIRQSAPDPDSILAEILQALRAGDRLTSRDAIQRFGYSRLAAGIHKLQRKYSISIDSRIIEVVSPTGRISHVAEYSIPETAP